MLQTEGLLPGGVHGGGPLRLGEDVPAKGRLPGQVQDLLRNGPAAAGQPLDIVVTL